MTDDRLILHGQGALVDELADVLRKEGGTVERSCRDAPGSWDPPPNAALYVVADPHVTELGALLGDEPASAYAFGLDALEAFRRVGGGRLIYLVRSFVSARAVAAFPEAAIVGASVAAVVRVLAAHAVGTETGVNLLTIGLLDRSGDEVLVRELAGSAPSSEWVAVRQGRLLRPDEVAAAASFLLSPAAVLLNGATLAADRTLSSRL